jgi:hypothetical protein
MRAALAAKGLREIPSFVTKSGPNVSFAGKDPSYISKNISVIDSRKGYFDGVRAIALCDDFAESGRTLFGLHAALSLNPSLAGKRIVLATVGISGALAAAERELEPPATTNSFQD